MVEAALKEYDEIYPEDDTYVAEKEDDEAKKAA